jgi:hypothetical protein
MADQVAQGVVIACLSIAIAVIVVIVARRGLLTFRYTIGWLSLLLVGALSSVFVQISEPLSSSIGVTPGVIVLTAGLLVLLAICIQLSISISGLQLKMQRLAEVVAIGETDTKHGGKESEVLVIVPALNEERTVGEVVRQLRAIGLCVVVIDDGSTDSTRSLAQSEGAIVISLPFNSGVGAALRAGLRYAADNGFRTVIQCDADGQHPIDHVTQLLETAEVRNCHLLIGSRFASAATATMAVSPLRRVAMWTLASSASRAAGRKITDVTSGFRVFRGSLINVLAVQLPDYYLGDTYEAVVAAGRAGYRIDEIPAAIVERTHGSSSATPFQAARLTVRAFSTAVLRLHVRLPSPTEGER